MRGYMIEHKVALSDEAEVFTLQMPSAAKRSAVFTGLSVYASVECEVTLERDGTLATTTGKQPIPLNSEDEWGDVDAYYSSNVGAGKTLARHVIPAGSTLSLELVNKGLQPGKNLTVRTADITGTVIINAQWGEY